MSNFCHAFDLDETVDDELRKNYTPSEAIKKANKQNPLNKNIENDSESLPVLPKITKTQSVIQSVNNNTAQVIAQPPKQNIGYNTKIKKGTVVEVLSVSAVSDWQRAGAKVKFKSKKVKNGRGFTIPSGTIFYGEIIESHQPQITCNGGLVVLRVYSMGYKGNIVPIDAYIIRANDKKIFFNNIKGKRTYLKTVYQKGNWGRALFGKMCSLTVNLGKDGSTLLLSPFPFVYGTICLGANTIISPITAFFSKGGHISIPAGSSYKIKFTNDAWIN